MLGASHSKVSVVSPSSLSHHPKCNRQVLQVLNQATKRLFKTAILERDYSGNFPGPEAMSPRTGKAGSCLSAAFALTVDSRDASPEETEDAGMRPRDALRAGGLSELLCGSSGGYWRVTAPLRDAGSPWPGWWKL